jgi:hypothetical protein
MITTIDSLLTRAITQTTTVLFFFQVPLVFGAFDGWLLSWYCILVCVNCVASGSA